MAEREEFFKYLNWLYCWFCEKECSVKVPFFYLQCGGVCCARCINNMREPKPKNQIKCGHCKKLVGSIRIHPDMPEKFRDNFENPEKYLFKYLEGENKQSQIRQGFIDYMDAKVESATKDGNNLRKIGNAFKKDSDEMANKRDQLIARATAVIPRERIEQMVETMTLEEIQQMPYKQMVAGQHRPRRRDSIHSPSQRSHSNSNSFTSQSHSSHNRNGPSSSSSLNDDFNHLILANKLPRQTNNDDRRRRSRDFEYYGAAETPRSIHQHQRQPFAATHRQSRDHYENMGAAAAVTSRRQSRRQSREFAEAAALPNRRESQDVPNARNVPSVSDPTARMAFHR